MASKTPGDLSAFGIAFSQNRIGLSMTTLIRTLARTSGSRALGRRNREACEEIGKAALGTVRFQRAGLAGCALEANSTQGRATQC